jgi:hypothetical protein
MEAEEQLEGPAVCRIRTAESALLQKLCCEHQGAAQHIKQLAVPYRGMQRICPSPLTPLTAMYQPAALSIGLSRKEA